MKAKIFLITVLIGISKIEAQNVFLPSGPVGIGTTSPTFPLQVQKISSTPALMIGGGYTGSPRIQVYGLDADANAWMGLGTDMSGGPYEHSIYFPQGPSGYTGKLTIGTYDGASYSPKLSILSNGYVGVGTTNPINPLTVEGSSFNLAYFKRAPGGGGAGFSLENGNGNVINFGCSALGPIFFTG
ncbi:hypothetical protein ACI6Q2_23380, partial [Chitinophagaceae bacterium LWZ2-11]